MYNVICKVEKERFIKYRNVSNLLSLCAYLDNHFSTWQYFNVYDKNTLNQVASYTPKNRPTSKRI